MSGSLYFSEVMGFLPCILCWYQRILMYPLAGVLAVGLLRRDAKLPLYVLPFSLLGMGFSTYHYLLEKTDWFGGVEVCRAGVSCTIQWINWLGFITIPFLALTAFSIITVMMLIALFASEPVQDESEPVPWAAALGIPVAVVAVFLTMGFINRPVQAAETGVQPTQLIIDPTPLAVGESMPITQTAAQTETHAAHLEAQSEAQAETQPAAGAALTGTTAAQAAAASTAELDPQMVQAGLALYGQYCAVCHGQNLEGVPQLGKALTGNEFIAANSDDQLVAFLQSGRPAGHPENTTGVAMPANSLTDEQAAAVVQYLRASAEGSAP